MKSTRDWDSTGTNGEAKVPRTWEAQRPEPKDLKKAGVKDTGLAMDAAKMLEKRRKELEKALSE